MNTFKIRAREHLLRVARAPASSGLKRRPMRGVLCACIASAMFPAVHAVELDPKSVEIVAADSIHWVRNAAGTPEQAVLFGDPTQPGPYVVRIKWLPGHFSRPHFHNNDRFFEVVSGTWWVGTGTRFDPEGTVPVHAGSYVIHHGGQVHFDGAKDEEAVIQIWGVGPVTSTAAEQK